MTSLIIKSSFSVIQGGGVKSNYGDLVRGTILLECIGSDFLWLTDSRSIGLLKYFIDKEKIATFDTIPVAWLKDPSLTVFNLDNHISPQCSALSLFGTWRGFLIDGEGRLRPQNDFIAALEPYARKHRKISWQEALVEGMGFTWQEQDYAKCRIESEHTAKVGLNWHVHPDWKSKRWPESSWKELESLIGSDYEVSWQQGLNDIDAYLRWISSCNVVVTCDTLGLHLASALRKKVVALVGATESGEYGYKRVLFLSPENRDCMPCNAPVCSRAGSCLQEISPRNVYEAVMKITSE